MKDENAPQTLAELQERIADLAQSSWGDLVPEGQDDMDWFTSTIAGLCQAYTDRQVAIAKGEAPKDPK